MQRDDGQSLREEDQQRADIIVYTGRRPDPPATAPEDIGLVVAGGPGTHSVYVPSFGETRAVTQSID